MRTRISVLLAIVISLASATMMKGADVLTPGFLKVSLYTNITGTAVSALTADPRYPATPSEVRYLRSFNTRDALPNDALENFGGRIEGYITPLVSGEYHFFLRSDDNSELWLSTDDTEAGAVLIAQETDCCDLFSEPGGGDAATTAAPITLIAGQRYFIMVLYKSPGGGSNGQSTDYAQVAWRPADDLLTPATALQPIDGAFLSTLASDAAGPTVTITQQPQSLTAEESARVTLSVAATTTPATNRVIQWQRNGENIPGATGTNYSFFVNAADNGVPYRAVVSVPGAVAQSSEAIITVSPNDTRPPTIVGARGGPNRPEVTLTFSEPVSDISGVALENYSITGPGGPLTITSAVRSRDGSQVLLTTDPQTPGDVYTVQVNNVTDAAVAGNTIAPNSQVTFTARGPWLQGEDGFVVFEAEDYDRNLDGRWLRDTTRGTPSGGVSMVNPNGIGGGEFGTRLEYDILFTKTGTNILWFRTGGNDGNDDSSFLHLDGQHPVERPGDLAAMSTGSGLTADFTWRSTPFQGGGQMTFNIETPGVHTIGLARREDGSYFDKFVITTDPTFNPTTLFGQQGPPITLRQGETPPAGTTLTITLQPTNIVMTELSTIALRAGVTTAPPASLVGYQWQRKQGDIFVDIPGATTPTFTINRIGLEWNGVVVRMRASSSGITRFTDEAQITVNPDVTRPNLLSASGRAIPQQIVLSFSEPLNVASATEPFNFRVTGPGGQLAVISATLLANQRTVILATDPQVVGTKYTVTVSDVYDQAATSNLVANAVARFYSLGAMREQGPDGLLVFEAENYDRNTDNRWVLDSAWGNPSGGLSVVLPNGGGGNETSSKLEYDLNFTQTGTHYVWYRASGPNGTDDSAWLHLDGARPPNRAAANQAAMQCVNGTNFVWETDPQDGERPYTIEITTPGIHVIALAVREDGALFDKFTITTDTNFNPNTFGPFGPLETREGMPPLATIALTSPANNQTFPAGANVPLAVAITDNGRTISKVEYFAGTQKIGESTTAPFGFNWQNPAQGAYAISAQLTDDVGDTARSGRAIVTVGNPNDVLLLVGTPDPITAGDAAIRDVIAGLGFNVVVMDDDLSTEFDGLGKELIVVSSSVASGSITTKFRNATAPVLMWEQANQDDFGMTGDVDGTDRGTVPGQTEIEIVDATHPMAAGFGPGVVTVATAGTDFSWGLPNTNAVRIATLVGNPNRVVIYGYEAGTNMMGGFVAPARRVMLFLTDGTYPVLNTAGRDLFAAALNWALGGGATPPGIQLTVTRGPSNLTLQWTGGTQPYKVQKKTALTDANWTDVTTTSQTSHTVPLDGQSGFFRIVQE